MKIDKLAIRNFKGIKSLDIEANGKSLKIYGDNATGKTTVLDSFLWLLFGKDSSNRNNFAIKPLDESGQELSGLDSEVEATLIVADKPMKLKRVYREVWTKKRGSSKAEYTGNTTDYFIDEVPKKASEYNNAIKDICEENIFKLITSPVYFNEQLHWKERREILLEMAGDVSDEDVVKKNPDLKKLDLEGRSISDHKKVIAAKRKKLNEEIEKIPVRIDEASRSIDEVDDKEIDKAKKEIKKVEKEISSLEKKLKDTESGDISKLEKEVAEFETKIIKIENRYEKEKKEALKELTITSDNHYLKIVDLKSKEVLKKKETEDLELEIGKLKNKLDAGREEYKKIKDEVFKFDQKDTCPACGQKLPEDKLENARQEAFKMLTESKEKRLKENVEAGKALKASYDDKKVQLTMAYKELGEITKTKSDHQEKKDKADRMLEEKKNNLSSVETDSEYLSIKTCIESNQKKIEEIKNQNKEVLSGIEKDLEETKLIKRELEKTISSEGVVEKAKKRIKELKDQEKVFAKEFEELENELYLCEKFIIARVELLEDKINSKFAWTKFKLFEVQINGGINECCEATREGVPYSDLNNASKINVGLDIINSLSGHYKFKAPVFIDNRESVVQLFHVDTKVISLIVSSEHTKLNVEVK